jgi:protein SCO1/2
MNRCRLLAALVLVLLTQAARADKGKQTDVPDVGIDQRLNEQVPLDLVFRDEDGKEVRLGDCLGGKPTILVLAYYRCPMLCTQVLNGLVDGLRGVPFDIGNQFNVVTVSFDARETYPLAAAKKANYVEQYGRPNAAVGWHFLTGEQEAIDRLAQAVGFRYQYDSKHDQFAHGSGIMVLTPQGKLARYFYGISYNPRDLRFALVDASENKVGSPVDKLLLLCYHYDPATGKYTTEAMSFVRLSGLLTLLILGAFLLVSFRRDWLKSRKTEVTAISAVK